MTIPEFIIAVIGSTAFIEAIRALLQRRKTNAEANHTAVDTANDALAMAKSVYEERIARLENQVKDLEERLTKAEARATGAESRLTDAEIRAHEFRMSVLRMKQNMDFERTKMRGTVTKLVGIINQLLDCIDPDQVHSVDRPAINSLIASLLNEYAPNDTES